MIAAGHLWGNLPRQLLQNLWWGVQARWDDNVVHDTVNTCPGSITSSRQRCKIPAKGLSAIASLPAILYRTSIDVHPVTLRAC